jgi:lysophospholipase L1-like esterase
MKMSLVLVLLTMVSSASAQVKNAHPGSGNISVAGDSLAAGYGATDYAVTPSGCLSAHFSSPVQNIAMAGTTSGDLETRLAAILANNSKLIFISSGGNDAVFTAYNILNIPVDETLGNMGRIFDSLIQTGALVVYLGLNPPMKGGERMPLITDLAISKGVLVVDAMDGFWGHTEWMHDVLHPNQAGYVLVCDRLVAAIKPYYP